MVEGEEIVEKPFNTNGLSGPLSHPVPGEGSQQEEGGDASR